MPDVLTTDPADTLSCSHGGALKRVPAPKLVVQNFPVLTGLPTVQAPPPCAIQTDTNAGTVTCTAMTVTSGQATKLLVGGLPVLLASVAGSAATPASPGGPLSAVVGPKKLSAA